MSVKNLGGDGYGETSGIVYGYEDDEAGSKEIRKVIRSGYGHIGVSPGDVEPMSATKSTLDDRLPKRPLPGDPGRHRDDCGDDIPAFACEECGSPVYVGRTCSNPACERCWPAAVKAKTVRHAGKLEGHRRYLYVQHNERKQIDWNHVVATLPDVLVDSDDPVERVLEILKTLLEKKWGVEGFTAIYHPYRIQDQYRKDQYEHAGASGEGDLTWADVLDSDDPYQYLKFEPHFHLFFAAPRYSFDYSVTEAVERETGWVFHRIEKEDSSVSVYDLEDLVHQLCYCYSHAGINHTETRTKLTSRLKGDLHNMYIPDGVEEQSVAAFCEAAPKLLGVRFDNMQDSSCEAQSCDCDGECHCEDDHPLHDLYREFDDGTNQIAGSSTSSSVAPEFDTPGTTSVSAGSTSSSSSESTANDSSPRSVPTAIASHDEQQCGGDLISIHEANDLLEDDDWMAQARYADALELAYQEWKDRTDGDLKPHTGRPDRDDDDELDDVDDAVQLR